jgi:hypothetical protein
MAKKVMSSSDTKTLKRKGINDEHIHEPKKPKKSVKGENGVPGKKAISKKSANSDELVSNKKVKKQANSANKKLKSSKSHMTEAKVIFILLCICCCASTDEILS